MPSATEDDTQRGPSVLTYVETRFNLLTVFVEKLEKNINDKFAADAARQQAYIKGYDDKFKHMEQMFVTGQDTAKRAVDKAEAAQSAHNVAANEWRGTLNDFKSTLISRPEFDRFYAEFSAYRLEASTRSSVLQGREVATKDNKEATNAQLTLIVAAVSAVVTIATSIALAFFRGHV